MGHDPSFLVDKALKTLAPFWIGILLGLTGVNSITETLKCCPVHRDLTVGLHWFGNSSVTW